MTSATAMPPSGGSDWPYDGARWWKFDFHTHTPASQDYGKGPDQASERSVEPRDWLLGFMRAGIDCVAVTDHNSGEWIDPLKAALAELEADPCTGYRPLRVFPGVEITANDGTHVLAIMDPSKSSADIDNLIGSVGFRGLRGASDTTSDHSVIQVVEAIDKAGAIAIPAHADRERGLWHLSGNTLETLLRSDRLYAVEIAETADKPSRYAELKVRWAEVLGSDSHHQYSASPSNTIGNRFTWVKMARPSLEGLRLALLDGNDYSIKRCEPGGSFNPPETPKYHLQELRILDARFMGRGEPATILLSPWLNAIVGGRGTGKSTLIHALRIVSRRTSEISGLDERSLTRRTFERFNRVPTHRYDDGGLNDCTDLSLIAVRDGVRHRIRWNRKAHTAHDGADRAPTVEVMTPGGWEASEVQEVTPERFPLRLFSQGQMSELADGDQQALLRIIDEAAGIAAHHSGFENARSAFMQTRARIRGLDEQLKRRADAQIGIDDTERKLRSFEDSGHAEVLKAHRIGSRQRQEVDRHFEVAHSALKLIENTADKLQPEDLDRRPFESGAFEDQVAIDAVASVAEALGTAAHSLKRAADELRARVESVRSSLGQSDWQAAVDHAVAAHQELIQALSAEGIGDPGEYGRLVQARSRIEGELVAFESMEQERSRLIAQSERELAELFESRCAVTEARRTFLSQVLEGNEFVRMELLAFGDSGSLRTAERSLRGAIEDEDHFESDILRIDGNKNGGILPNLLEGLPAEPAERRDVFKERIDRLREQFTEACQRQGRFGGHFNKFLRRRYQAGPEFLDRLLTWFPEDVLRVEYSRDGSGSEFAPIAQASAGQRAAAMLAFLLAHGDEPLVLDQPEDDLDNHLIYDLVVRQIRENKLRRQIITATHNPNIVVNGDAEMVHALGFLGGQCRVMWSGSLQDLEIRNEVCRVMEGGREALERRYRRIASSLSDV